MHVARYFNGSAQRRWSGSLPQNYAIVKSDCKL